MNKNKILEGSEANPATIDHDQRVREIKAEMRASGKEAKIREEWKAYFKAKGYWDDECDLALVLASAPDMGAERAKARKRQRQALVFVAILIAIVSWLAYWLGGWFDLLKFFPAAVVVGSVFVLFAGAINFGGEGLVLKLFAQDFGGRAIKDMREIISQWKVSGGRLFSENGAYSLLSFPYDGRETYWMGYEYEIQRLGHKYPDPIPCTLVIQRVKGGFPFTDCRLATVDPIHDTLNPYFLDAHRVKLEGVDFNQRFNVYSKAETDAFYVFNPRFMEALLQKENVLFMETFGDWLAVGLKGDSQVPKFHTKEVPIRFAEYEACKLKMLEDLDTVNDLADVLSREIVDDGSKRSEAKIV